MAVLYASIRKYLVASKQSALAKESRIRVSKTIAPNMRLGWITSNPLFSRKLEILTDNSTQHPHGLGQSFLAEILAPSGWGLNGYCRWLLGLRNEYQRKRNLFFEIFQREVGEGGFASTNLPIAGMMFWIRIDVARHPRFTLSNPVPKTGPKTNTKELLDELFKMCFNGGILIMPGVLFAMRPTDGSIAEQASSVDHVLDVSVHAVLAILIVTFIHWLATVPPCDIRGNGRNDREVFDNLWASFEGIFC